MYKISTVIKRLEAVASRLEDVAEALEGSTAGPHDTELKQLLSQIRSISEQPQAFHSTRFTIDSSDILPIPIQEFEKFLERSVGRFSGLSDVLGGAVAEQARAVSACFQAQLTVLVATTRTTKPDTAGWQELIRPIKDSAARVVDIQENNKFDLMHNHLACVADGIPVVGWMDIEMRAFNHVDKFLGYAQYFGNKVTKEYKEKDTRHVEWVQSYYQIFRDLSGLIKTQFPTGLHWLIEDGKMR